VLAETERDLGVRTELRIGRGPLASWASRTGLRCEPGSIAWWWEATSDKPSFVVVQAAPDVDRVRATGSDGAVFDLVLGETDSNTGLRFGASPTPPGVSIVEVVPAPG
jgi:hypothetical protein